MRESMARLTPFFSANRTVREYTERHYLPAAAAYCSRASAGGAFGDGLLNWRKMIATQWGRIYFGAVKVETRNSDHIFEVQVYLNELDPDAVRVEVYADPVDGGEPFRQEMTRGEQLAGSARGYVYTAHVPAVRPPSDYTPRIVPFKAGVFVPLEAPEILWQR